MKRLNYFVISGCATLALAIAWQATAQMPQPMWRRDWRRELALMGNDLPVLLHYQPTNGASYAGQVRTSMDVSTVHP